MGSTIPEINIFYGITTTTLVVLSSTALVVFKYIIDSIQSDAKSCDDSIKELDNKEKGAVLDILGNNTQILKTKYENLSTNIFREYCALFLVIFLSAISILVTLSSGVFDLSISIKWILSINLLSIIIYIAAFLGLLWNVRQKKRFLKTIISESKMFIKSIDDTNTLYRKLNNKENKERRSKNKQKS